jgi:hypothetical protein
MRVLTVLMCIFAIGCGSAIEPMLFTPRSLTGAIELKKVEICAAKIAGGKLVYNWKSAEIMSAEYLMRGVDEDAHIWLSSGEEVTFEAWLDKDDHALGIVRFTIRVLGKRRGMMFVRVQVGNGVDVSDWSVPFPVWRI